MKPPAKFSTDWWDYTVLVSTRRPRHFVTETDEVRRALADAAVIWPEIAGDTGALLRRLIEAGATAIRSTVGVRGLVEETSGVASGSYPRSARAELLEEWPA